MGDRVYFKISPSSLVMDVIREAEDQQKVFYRACRKLEKELPPKTRLWLSNNSHVVGAGFVGEPPLGWRAPRGKQYAVPNRKTVEGRAVAKRIAEMPQGVDAFDFSNRMSSKFKKSYSGMEGLALMFTVYEKIGEWYVLSVPAVCKAAPPGCKELKMSEYWRLKEQRQGQGRKRSRRCVR